MNIFVTDPCPVISASFLDNKRVNKMITESLQMLGWAMYMNGASPEELPISKGTGKPYAINKRHLKHPCTLWVSSTKGNYQWLVDHCVALQKEWKRRGGGGQEISDNIRIVAEGIKYLPDGNLTEFVNAAANQDKGISYKHIKDVHLAYQLYLNDRWDTDKLEPKWG